MLRFQSFLQRILLVVTACIIAVTAALYIVSSSLTRRTYAALTESELRASAETGARALRAYASGALDESELRALANPQNNPGGLFLVLLNADGAPLCYTDSAAPYIASLDLADALYALDNKETFLWGAVEAGDDFFLMGRKTSDGYALAGKPARSYDSAARAFRQTLLTYMSPLCALLALASILLSLRIAKPASIIVEAAQRLSEGELVRVPDHLPYEMKDVGRAFNHMSRRLSESIGALTYERDTVSLVLEGLSEGVIAVDAQGDLLHENGAARRLLGDRQSPAYQQTLRHLRSAANAPGEPLRLRAQDKTLLAVFSPLPAGAAARRGAVATIRDITEQERLERTRYDYVANISHELRTPLASMRGVAEGLRDGLVTNENDRQRYYDMIVSEIRRLSRLVNDLLELSSLQSNPAAFETEAVDCEETLRELQDRHARLFSEKGLRLALSLPENALPAVNANEDRLQQVLTIFLDNALKYTPGGGTVTLGAQRLGRGVRFFVRDTGIGMDEHTVRHAFERFHRAESWHGGQGSGLGLSIAREILLKMDVKISVQSEPGKGSEFSFILPGAG